ncbi:MAG: flagellar brake domain-containing protein [Dehalobacterium sp.]
MQINDYLSIKQKIEVRKPGDKDYYISSVQDFNEKSINIDVPLLARRGLILSDHEIIEVRFVSNNAVYEFETRVLARHAGSIPYYEIAVPDEVQEGQRRSLFRLDITLDVGCWLEINELPSNKLQNEPAQIIRAKTIDISGSGVRISSYVPLKLNQKITLAIKFEDMEIQKMPAVVMWINKETRREQNIYYAGLRFLNISRKTQDNLVRYLFKIQTRRRLFDKIGE